MFSFSWCKCKKDLQLGNHLVAALHPGDGVVDKLVNDGAGRLLLVDNGGALAHEQRAEGVNGVVVLVDGEGLDANLLGGLAHLGLVARVDDVHELVEVGLVGDGALCGELLHLLLALRLPVVDVGVVVDAHGAAGEDDGADVVVVAGVLDGLLVDAGRAGLVGEDEARADPDAGRAHHERGGEQLAVVDAAGGNDLDGAAGEGRLGVLDGLDDGGDEDGGGGVAGVAAALATLGADDVDANVNALLGVLDVADHVHVQDAGLVQAVDDVLGGDTDGRDEELGTGLDDDVDELVELALGVVVAAQRRYMLAYVGSGR